MQRFDHQPVIARAQGLAIAVAIAKRNFNVDTAHQSGVAGLGMLAPKLCDDTEASHEGVHALKENRKPDFRKFAT